MGAADLPFSPRSCRTRGGARLGRDRGPWWRRWLFFARRPTIGVTVFEENRISRDIIKSHWPRLQGKLRANWTKLTLDDVSFTEGDRDYLTSRLRARYGFDETTAKAKVARFERMLS